MRRIAFHYLLKRYLDGNCSADEERLVKQWYMMLSSEAVPPLRTEEMDIIEEELWQKVISKAHLKESRKSTRHSIFLNPTWQKFAIAASLAGLMVLTGYFLIRNQTKEGGLFHTSSIDFNVEKVNHTSMALVVNLNDGSRVTLKPYASISFPKDFDKDKRKVILKGEAYFEVSKDKSRPFYVYHNNLITKVVGTSFIIKGDQKDKLNEVIVLTGKVIVSENTQDNSILDHLFSKHKSIVELLPNQRAIYDVDTKGLVKTIVAEPVPTISTIGYNEKEATLLFNDTPVKEVIAELMKTYRIEIKVTNESISRCTFTGDLNIEDFYINLNLICKSIGAEYEIKDTRIFINGGNCN